MTTIKKTIAEKFALGSVYCTRGVHEKIPIEVVMDVLRRHASGDWGDVCLEDRDANEQALLDEVRILSVFRLAEGVKVWVITEADRSATTVLLPSEY